MLTAFELARRVRAREISPVAIVEAHLDAIARHNPRLNAVVTLTAERALGGERHDGIEPRVVTRDRIEMRLDDCDGRYLARADPTREFEGGEHG